MSNDKIANLQLYIANAQRLVRLTRQLGEENNLLHTQEYIEFENFLNKVSTMDPTDRLHY